MSWLVDLFRELRRRRVFRMTAFYVIAGWVAVQVTSEILPALNIEDSAIRYAWIAILAGFPLALIFSWKYDFTTHGIQRTGTGTGATPEELKLGRTDFLLLAGLVLVVVYGVVSLTQSALREQFAIDVAPQTRDIDPGSIAVLGAN